MSARNRELLALVPVAVLLIAGFTAVFITRSDEIGDLSLIYGGYFFALCLAAHLFLRVRLPYADPYLFPLCAAAGGDRARRDLPDQGRPGLRPGLGVRARVGALLPHDPLAARLPRPRALPIPDRDRGIVLLLGPFITRNEVNGAYLGVDIGPISLSRRSWRRSASSSSSPAIWPRSARCSRSRHGE